jgi:hypothetical protein
MLHVGLDLSRRRLDVCLLDEAGGLLAETAVPSDADGLRVWPVAWPAACPCGR